MNTISALHNCRTWASLRAHLKKPLRLLALLLCSLAPLLHAQTGLTRLGEFKVNTTTSGDQRGASVACAPDGQFVVAWMNGPDSSIYFQRYNAAGSPVGSETKANSNPVRVPDPPSVAMDQEGNFVVAWVRANDGSGAGVAAQRFRNDGQPIGVGGTPGYAEFLVNTGTANNQETQGAAMLSDGRFAICWVSTDQPNAIFRSFVQFYNASGAAIGGEVQLSSILTDAFSVEIGARPSGGYGVIWTQKLSGTNQNIMLRLFAADGTPEQSGAAFFADEDNDGIQEFPAIAFAPDGSSVVAFAPRNGDANGSGVFAQRMSAAGAKVGTRLLVNTAEGGNQVNPAVAFDSASTFVVGYRSFGFDGNGEAFAARRFNVADGTQATAEFPVNTFITGNQTPLDTEHTIAADGAGNLVFVWTSEAQDGSSGGIYAEKFYQPNQGPPLTEFRVNTATTGDQLEPAVASASDGRFVVVWHSASEDGSGTGIVGQRYDAAGRRFGPPFRVNLTTAGDQTAPTVGMDGNGNFVVTWVTQDQGGNGLDIVGRRFSWDLATASTEFFANAGQRARDQIEGHVAVAADGRFAVTWRLDDVALELRCYVQFFTASGTSVGGVIELDPSRNIVVEPDIVVSPLNRFVVIWRHGAGFNLGDIYLRQFNLDGAAIGGLVLVDFVSDGYQLSPSLAVFSDGTMLASWHKDSGDSSGRAVIGQFLDGDANKVRPQFLINEAQSGDQDFAGVIPLGTDRALAVYNSNGLDNSSVTVASRIFDRQTGAEVVSETVVNAFSQGFQGVSSLRRNAAADAFGNYVVVWQSENQDGSGYGVYATKVFVSTPPVVTTGAATNPTASTATLNGAVTPNDVAVDVAFELAESEAGLDTAGVTTTPAVPASLAAGLTTPQAVTKNFTGLTLGIGNTHKTYYYRTKATPSGGAPIYGETVAFTVENTPPEAMDDTFVIIGNEQLAVLLNDSDDDPGDTLRIVSFTAPTGGSSEGPQISTDSTKISYNPNDLFFDATNGDSFTYTISDRATGGLTATATVSVFSVKVLRGLYSGLIGGDGNGADAVGRFDITISPTGLVTGSFKWQGRPYSFKGGAPIGSDGKLTITRTKIGSDGNPVVPAAQIEITLTLNPVTRVLTGTLTDTETTPDTIVQAELTGTATTDDVTTLPEAGTFNAVIDTDTSAALAEAAPSEGAADDLPKGVGFAQITVKRSGKKRPARFVGRMPDDQPFSSGARTLVRALRAAGGARYPLFVDNLYPRTRDAQNRLRSSGFVSSNVDFTRATDRFETVTGLNWERRANVGTRFPGGFRTGLAALTATLNAIRYGRPAPGNLPAGIANDTRSVNAKIEFREGNLTSTVTRALKLTRSGSGPVKSRVEPLNPAANVEALKLSVSAGGGKFSGSFIHPSDAALPRPPRTKFNGVFQGQDGQGTFTGPTNTGRIQILAQ